MKFKKLTAAVLAVLMLFGLASCGDTSTVYTIDGTKITPGLYRAIMLNSYYSAVDKLEDPSADVWKQSIEGVSFGDYVEQLALDDCKTYVAIEKKFDELGLTLTSDEEAQSTNYYKSIWDTYGDYFEDNGISQATMVKVGQNSTRKSRIFQYYYYEGGTKAVAQTEIDSYIKDNYIAYKSIIGSLLDSDGNKVTGNNYTAIKAIYQSYFDRAAKGEDFNDLIDEYQAYIAEQNGTTATDPSAKEESDYYSVMNKNTTTASETLLDTLNSAKASDVKLVEDDSYVYVLQKLDVMSLTDSYESLSQSAISDLKSGEFTDEIKAWYADYSVESNSSALSKYKPEKLKLS